MMAQSKMSAFEAMCILIFLKNKAIRREVQVTLKSGQEFLAAYSPARFVAASRRKDETNIISLADRVEECVVDWELEDENARPVPLTHDEIHALPLSILSSLWQAVERDADDL